MKLQLKRSNVLEGGFAKAPTTSQLEYGELAVNYNLDDPCIFLKDSDNNVIRISGKGVPALGDADIQTGTLDERYPLKSGDTFTGEVILSGDPLQALGAAPKQYVDAVNTALSADISTEEGARIAADALKLDKAGGTITGNLLVGTGILFDGEASTATINGTVESPAAPTSGSHLTNKDYVDNNLALHDTTVEVDAKLANYDTTTVVDGKLANYDTSAVVDNKLSNYDTTAVVDSKLSNYDTSTEVDTKIQNVIGAAPAALDTLNELAASLGDDANFASTVTNGLATKVNTTHLEANYDTSAEVDAKIVSNSGNGSITFRTHGEEAVTDAFTLNQSSNQQIDIPQIRYNDLANLPTIPTNNNQLANGAGYVTSSGNTVIGTDADIDTSGAQIIDKLTMTDGVITAHGTRNLTLGDLGYTGATNANYITNNNQLSNGAGYVTSSGNTVIGTDSDINTSGATVVDQLNMTDGVITSHTTRTMTLADLGYTGATDANKITNNNQLTNGAGYQTSSQVNTAIQNVVNGAPSALNTLNELAAALGDDSNFASTMTTSLAAKLDDSEASTTNSANKLVRRNGSGDIYFRYGFSSYLNMSHTREQRTGDTIFYSSTDDYIRKTDATGMRSSLNVPTRTGGNASGTWGINVTGSAASASSATDATNANKLRQNGNGSAMTFYWNGQTGQPSWLWGSNNGTDVYVYNPSNFSVNYAASAGNADTVDNIHASSFLRSDANDSASGTVTFNGRVNIRGHLDLSDNEYLYFGSGDDVEFFCNGSHMYTDLNSGIGNWYIRDGSTTRFTFDDAGHFTATGDITSSSDIRLKENLVKVESAVSKVNELNGYSYDRKDLGERQYGVVAQEVEKLFPEMVTTDVEGMKGVAYNQLTAVLIEAVKELSAEIEILKSQIK